MNHTTSKKPTKKLQLLYLNARSILNKLDDIAILLQEKSEIDIILVTETWLYSNQCKYVNFVNYTGVFESRENKRGGGVAIFVSNKLSYNIIECKTFSNWNYVSIKINNIEPKINVSAIYKPPQVNMDNFINILDEILKVKKKWTYCSGLQHKFVAKW